MAADYERFFKQIARRYGDVDPDALVHVLCPVLIPIARIDPKIYKEAKQAHYRASFEIPLDATWLQLMQPGRTGKFIPKDHAEGSGAWRDIAKGRLLGIDQKAGRAFGEIYCGGGKEDLELAIGSLTEQDFFEVDQFGAAAKVLSGLVEYTLSRQAEGLGYIVHRMPEDIARHIGAYYNYDFEFEKDGAVKKIEVKSLWGTNTRYARLIHSKTAGYPTSSCLFATQDIFAVSLFLRTGNIHDFAFARSTPIDVQPYGLPRATNYPDHVHQNPICEIGNGTWFAKIDDVWNLP